MKSNLGVRKMVHRNAGLSLLCLAVLSSLACGPGSAAPSTASNEAALISASSVPSLGAAASFAVLAGTAVTCTNGTITGDVGVYPGTAITQTSCPVTGTLHAGDTVAAQAHNDFVVAYDAFAALPCDTTLATLDVDQTLSPGIYCFDAAATATNHVLTLDGPSNGIWIFKVGTLGTGALTGTSFSVVMKDGTTPPCNNVYWWVAQATTMTTSNFVGTILAGAAITFTGGTFNGDALAKAAVTITGSAAVAACAAAGGGGAGGPPSCKGSDFVTGGGWIRGTPSGAKGNFGVAGGIKHGAFWGHLTYEDHGKNGLDVKGQSVTGYIALNANTRRIEGTARVNGHWGFTYQVDVSDNGEPGRNDTYRILLSNGYSASGKLGGGNIQLHKGPAHGRSCKGDDGEDDDGHDDDGDNHDHDDDHEKEHRR